MATKDSIASLSETEATTEQAAETPTMEAAPEAAPAPTREEFDALADRVKAIETRIGGF